MRDAESAARSGGRLVRMSLRAYVYMVRRLVHAHDIYLVDLVSSRLVVIHAVRMRVYIFMCIHIYICVIFISISNINMQYNEYVCNAV